MADTESFSADCIIMIRLHSCFTMQLIHGTSAIFGQFLRPMEMKRITDEAAIRLP